MIWALFARRRLARRDCVSIEVWLMFFGGKACARMEVNRRVVEVISCHGAVKRVTEISLKVQ
jgi:hypothetical protein